ncbi:UDP-N-acetylglucosamine transporter UGNT1-like isoform X1 [Phragmites australis]|uniref:UDP-N-acetylglucosamine transporter UGNT1-like isoform X1 n=2 Tax=Phragmites australis TaxID=29695 RepID=UPI002D781AA1|nr:UDP-N-acetylglucosamine transporter UGNT1-like isoform X1 [Phragmites australis]
MAKGGGERGLLLPVSADGAKGNGGGGGDDAALFKGSAMTRRGAAAALSYMACSVLLVMFNKAALSSYNFPCANVITLLQMVCSTCLLYVLRRLKIISFINSEPSVPSDSLFFVPFRILLRTTPLSLAYLLYMLASMESVRGVNVPMYTTLRRTTVVFTMTMEYFLSKQKHTPPIIGSVALIIFGAFVAGARDLSFDARGYAIVFVANITTAVYLATINRIGKSSGLNSFGLMWCNGLVCGPSVLFLTYIQGDLKRAMEFPYLYSPGFQAVLLFSCILAFLLNYTIFWNTILNSALTQSMCGNLKDFFTVGIGWVLFGGLPFDLLNIMGQGLGFLGSGLYAYCKIKGK